MIRIGDLTLTSDDLKTHVHGIGKSRSGKSKLIELICRELVIKNRGFCLIDPHGSLFRDILEWLAVIKPSRRIHLFEPSNTRHVVGFNPFTLDTKEPDWIMTKTDKMVAATMRAWGSGDITSTPRLAKWLKRLYYTLIEQDLSIADVDCFFNYSQAAKRNRIINNIQNESIKAQWLQLYEMKPSAFASYIESMENRIEIFAHPQVRRILGLRKNCIDLRRIINSQHILLANLQPSPAISDENNRVIGTLLINEIWQVFRERTKADARLTYYLIVDECQKYLTPDIAAMLDEAAKYGLHLMLFHQREAQLDKNLSSALQNAQTKFIFSTEDDPKEQRHFTFSRPNGERTDAEVPEVKTFPLSDATLAAYKERLLAGFMSAPEIDVILNAPENTPPQSDVSDDDLFR